MFPDTRIHNVEIAETMAYKEAPYRMAAIAARQDGFPDLVHANRAAANAVSATIYENELESLDPDLYIATEYSFGKGDLLDFALSTYGNHDQELVNRALAGRTWSALVQTESVAMIRGDAVVEPAMRAKNANHAIIPLRDMVTHIRKFDYFVAQDPANAVSANVFLGPAWRKGSATLLSAFVSHALSEIRAEIG